MFMSTLTFLQDADWLYDVAGSTLSTPNDLDIITRHTVTRAFTLPQNLVGSQLDVADKTTTGDFELTFYKTVGVAAPSAIGIFTFQDGVGAPISKAFDEADSITGLLSSGDVSFAVGDILTVETTLVNSGDDVSFALRTLAP